MIFMFMSMVNAVETNNDSNIENSNLMEDNVNILSTNNELEVSNEYSISKTNIVNSHDDNFGNYSNDNVLGSTISYEDNEEIQPTSNAEELEEFEVDNYYNTLVSTKSDVLTVTPVSTQLNISDTHYVKSGTYFEVTLKDNAGKALSNQNISLTVNGKSYSGLTNASGVASIKTSSLAVGTYTVSLNYAGNSDYSSASLSKKVKVLSSVIGSGLTKYYGQTSQYKATFWKGNSVLANTKVSFKVNGKTYSATTDAKGVASIKINLAAGKYTIKSSNPYSGEQASDKIVVKKDSVTIKHGSGKTYIIPNHKYSFTVTLKSKHGVLVKKAKVKFMYNHKTVTAKTNSKGKATIKIPVLSKGSYKISYEFGGNNNFYSKSSSGYLIIRNPSIKLKASVLKMNYNDGSKFKVKLTDDGKVLTNKMVKIKINGKSSNVKTNSKGYASKSIGNINPGIYKITYSYSSKGSEDYNYGTSKVIIFKFTAKLSSKNLVMNKGDGSTYNITIKDKSGKILKNVFVKSVINGKSYLYQSNSKGVASLKINLGVGYYKVSSIVADPCYKSKTISKHVLVNGTKFIADDLYVSSGSSATFSVKLVDGKSNAYKNVDVTFKFNSKSFNVKTDSKGIAKLSLGKLSDGKYDIKYAHGAFSDGLCC